MTKISTGKSNIWRKLDQGSFFCCCIGFPCCGALLFFYLPAIYITSTAVSSSSLSFKHTMCTTTSSEYRGMVTCAGVDYPCLLVKVSYSLVQNGTDTETEGFLYNEETEIIGNKRCSVDCCRYDEEGGYWTDLGRLTAFNKTYGKTNTTYGCSYNPTNTSQVLARRTVSHQLIFHSFFWASVISLCIIVFCTWLFCCTKSESSKKPTPALTQLTNKYI
ncbi:uncharacterized protein LOC144877996 [Branchiostoma floridae x Branchiostoma japonicum]